MDSGFPRGGYLGRILRVDLGTGEISREPLNEDFLMDYIGGTGLGVRMLYDELKPGTDPLAPENPLVFTTGPLTGTVVPGSGTYTVASKNVLT